MIDLMNVFRTNRLFTYNTKYLLVPFMFLLMILSLVGLLPPADLMMGEGEEEDMVE